MKQVNLNDEDGRFLTENDQMCDSGIQKLLRLGQGE